MKASDFKTYNINTNGTVVIPLPANPSGKLLLKSLVINTKGSSSNTATIYDSNPTIGANDANKIGKIDTTVLPGEFEYEVTCFNGIYIVVATGTAADITVVYAETQ